MQTDFIKSSAPEAWDLQGTGSADGAGGGSSSAGSAVNTQDTSQNFAGFTDIGSGFEGGNVLFRNSGYLRLGQGDNSVILDANDALYRVAVGSETYATAPFRVQKDGKFHAGSSSQYIDWDGTKLTIAGDVVQIDTSTGAVKGSLQNVISLTAGETISGATTPVPVYLASDGKVYKADADSTTPEARTVLGFCITDTTINNSATIQTDGILTVPTITLSETISSTTDQYTYDDASATAFTINIISRYYSAGFRTGMYTGNISSVEFNLSTSTSTDTAVVDIFAMDNATGKPTGSVLGTSAGVTVSPALKTFTFSTPVTVTPNTNYCAVLRFSSYTAGTMIVRGATGNRVKFSFEGFPSGAFFSSTNSGSTWGSQAEGYFKTYTTNRTTQVGYPVYLSATAGTYSLTAPATIDCSHIPIATVISSTQVKIGYNVGMLLYKATPDVPAATSTPALTIHVPKFARYAMVAITSDSWNMYNFQIDRFENNIISSIDDQGAATENPITTTWTDNMIIIEDSDTVSATFDEIRIYFYN